MRPLLCALSFVLISSSLSRAQQPLIPMPPNRGPLIPYSYSPYANGIRVSTALTFGRALPAPQVIGVQTTVAAPDGATVRVAGYNAAREGRNEFGAPGLGRPYRNTGYGRTVSGSTIAVRARVIILREEEERQTDVRSR